MPILKINSKNLVIDLFSLNFYQNKTIKKIMYEKQD